MTEREPHILPEENQDQKQQYEELKRKEGYFEILHYFASSMLHLSTTDEVLWDIAQNVISRLGFVDCVIYMRDPRSQMLVQRAAYGPKNPREYDIKNPIRIPLGSGLVGTVAKTGEPIIVSDTSQDPRYIMDDENRLSEMVVPILQNGNVIGVIDSEHPQANFYTQEHLHFMTTIASMAAAKINGTEAVAALAAQRQELERLFNQRSEELQHTVEKLKRSNIDLEQFAYAASHDLQEPLRMISSYLQLIQQKEPTLTEESRQFMAFAQDGAQRMSKLLQGLLAYSKLNAENLPMQEVDLNTVFDHAIANLSMKINEHRVRMRIPQNMPVVKGIQPQLIQLVQNLLANAIKFRSANAEPLIQVDCLDLGDYIQFNITDNGIGIAENHREQIFKLFARLHQRHEYEGSGIGLAVCKRIVEKHRGKIWVEAPAEYGSVFCFTLKK